MAGKPEDFGRFLNDVAIKGTLGMGIGIGSGLKIFDVMADLGPKSYSEIAEAGKWKARYIKEWLNLMVCGDVVEYIKEKQHYHLPEDRQKYLVTAGKTENRIIFLQSLNLRGLVSEELKKCFQLDGPDGIPYSSYIGFHEWRQESTQARFHWEGPIGLKNLLMLIPDVFQNLKEGIRVCDGGSSTGHQVMLLAENLPNSSFLGFDLSEHSIELAKKACREKKLSNMTFETQDACDMPSDWTDAFDLFTVFDVVHDVPEPKRMLKEVYRVLKPNGAFLMMDINVHSNVANNIGNPNASTVYFCSLFHCMPVSLHEEKGQGLGAAWGIEAQEEYLAEAGFRDIELLPTEDTRHSYFVAYK